MKEAVARPGDQASRTPGEGSGNEPKTAPTEPEGGGRGTVAGKPGSRSQTEATQLRSSAEKETSPARIRGQDCSDATDATDETVEGRSRLDAVSRFQQLCSWVAEPGRQGGIPGRPPKAGAKAHRG